MRKKIIGKKIPVSGIIITFEDNKKRTQRLDKSPIVAIRPIDNWIIKGAKIPNPVIEVFFEDIPSYPIGYFRDSISRDVAITIIRKAKEDVHLPYEVFFRPTQKTIQEMQSILGQSPFKVLLEHKMRKLKEQGLEFLPVWNAVNQVKLNPLHLKDLKNGMFPPELNRGKFVIDCLFFFGIDGSLKKRLYEKKVSPISFWTYSVDAMVLRGSNTPTKESTTILTT